MVESTQFMIGAKVDCRDGECGEVIRLVVDPLVGEVTHIVVEPKHREGIGRLVPLALVASGPTRSHSAARWPSSRRSISPRRHTSCRAAVR